MQLFWIFLITVPKLNTASGTLTVISDLSGTEQLDETTATCPAGYSLIGCKLADGITFSRSNGLDNRGNSCTADARGSGGAVKSQATCIKTDRLIQTENKSEGMYRGQSASIGCKGGFERTNCVFQHMYSWSSLTTGVKSDGTVPSCSVECNSASCDLRAVCIKYKGVWSPVVRDKSITADLETSYLHVRTDSYIVGSGDKTLIWYYDEEEIIAGGIGIWFSSTVKYRLQCCKDDYTPFPTSLPAEHFKEWIIEKRGTRTKVYCNGKQVLDITASSDTCDNPNYADTWDTYWGRDVSKILFSSKYDIASDSYRIGSEMPNCTGLKSEWTNMVTDTDFPVPLGSSLSLSCEEGYELTGDSIITCHHDTQFYLSTEPNCEYVWNTVVRDEYIPADLETSYLYMRTNSTMGSGDKTVIQYRDEEGNQAGGIGIWFSSTVKYVIVLDCRQYNVFPAVPPKQDNEWIIEKRGYRTKVYCNGEQILDITPSSETCDDNRYAESWDTRWGRDVNAIWFPSNFDTASDSYYIGSEMPNCTGLKSEWSNMVTDTDFPVPLGNSLSLSCEEGYRLRGDSRVTCQHDTQFYSYTEPRCERVHVWSPVGRDKDIIADLETSYLHVRTDSAAGSWENALIDYYDEERELAGGIEIEFSSPINYKLKYCQASTTSFPTSIPAEQDKEWIIKKRGYRTRVYCNGKQVLDITASSETCDYRPYYVDNWDTCWGREVSKVKFYSSLWDADTASDSYYIGSEVPKCTGLKSEWTNMVTDTHFPVPLGSGLYLSCEEGYQLTGDRKVICQHDMQFYFSTEPNCEQCEAGTYKATIKTNWCTACGEDEYSEAGATGCNKCPPGSTADEEQTKCESCPAGTYKSSNMTECAQCGENTISTLGAVICLTCPVGTVANEQKTQCESCPAGTYKNSNMTKCAQCKRKWNSISTQGAEICSLCPAGTVTNEQKTQCVECGAGTYQDSGRMNRCTACEENEYSEVGATSCNKCPLGSTADEEQTKCESCPAGTYKSSNMTKCAPCGEDTISTLGAGFCSGPCPAGTAANERKIQCESCPAGTYKSSNMTECTQCGENTISTLGAGFCSPCPTGNAANDQKTQCGYKIILTVAWSLAGVFVLIMVLITIVAARKFLQRKCACWKVDSDPEYVNVDNIITQPPSKSPPSPPGPKSSTAC